MSGVEMTNTGLKKAGVLAILGASLMWAVEPILAKLAYANSDYLGSRGAGALQTSTIRATVGAGTILYYEGLKRIKAVQVSALELSTPFFAALLGFLILGEWVTVMQISGMILLFIGVFFLSKKEEAYF